MEEKFYGNLNQSTSFKFRNLTIVYGKTPEGIKRLQLQDMAETMNTSPRELCKTILTKSDDEIFNMLKKNYNTNDIVKEFYDKFPTLLISDPEQFSSSTKSDKFHTCKKQKSGEHNKTCSRKNIPTTDNNITNHKNTSDMHEKLSAINAAHNMSKSNIKDIFIPTNEISATSSSKLKESGEHNNISSINIITAIDKNLTKHKNILDVHEKLSTINVSHDIPCDTSESNIKPISMPANEIGATLSSSKPQECGQWAKLWPESSRHYRGPLSNNNKKPQEPVLFAENRLLVDLLFNDTNSKLRKRILKNKNMSERTSKEYTPSNPLLKSLLFND